MLCFSLGYTTYTLVSLRGQLLKDNLFALNEGAHLIELLSCLRSRGVSWIVPTLMSAEIPLACLNALRLLAEVGVPRSSTVWQLCLGARHVGAARRQGSQATSRASPTCLPTGEGRLPRAYHVELYMARSHEHTLEAPPPLDVLGPTKRAGRHGGRPQALRTYR